jgi:hypothetical protein
MATTAIGFFNDFGFKATADGYRAVAYAGPDGHDTVSWVHEHSFRTQGEVRAFVARVKGAKEINWAHWALE